MRSNRLAYLPRRVPRRSWREDWYNAQVDHQATVPETVRFVNFVVDRIAALE